MKAEELYLRHIKNFPEDIGAWLELAKMYAETKLWKAARDHIQKAARLFPNDSGVEAATGEIEAGISEILDAVKEEWIKGDKNKTQKLLNEYLLFSPENEQTILLKDVLKQLDATLAADSTRPPTHQTPEKQFEELLAKAGKYIGILEFDQAIGILEGLIESFPVQTAVLREKIGDCRVLQRDFKSALFNYEQSLSTRPGSDEIRAKIRKARQGMEAAG
jgi:tetratricopeptide (TPR) repeat protein